MLWIVFPSLWLTLLPSFLYGDIKYKTLYLGMVWNRNLLLSYTNCWYWPDHNILYMSQRWLERFFWLIISVFILVYSFSASAIFNLHKRLTQVGKNILKFTRLEEPWGLEVCSLITSWGSCNISTLYIIWYFVLSIFLEVLIFLNGERYLPIQSTHYRAFFNP